MHHYLIPTRYVRNLELAAIVVAAAILVACNDTTLLGSPEITLATDSSTEVLGSNLLNSYENVAPNAELALQPLTRTDALQAVRRGEVDAALILQPLDDHSDLFSTPIATEYLVVVANPETGVSELSLSDVRAVFSGRVVSWNEVGGNVDAVSVIAQSDGRSTREAFEYSVMLGQEISSAAILSTTEDSAIEAVKQQAGGVTVISNSTRRDGLTTLAIDGVLPTLDEGATSAYPIATPIIFVSAEEPQGELLVFLEWILSNNGQQVIRRQMRGLSD